MPLRTEREVRRRRGCWLGSTEGNRCKLGMENGNWDSAGCDAGALWSQALRLWSTLKFQNQNWHQYWTPLQNLFFFVDLDRSSFFMYITNLQQKWTLNQHSIVYDQYLQPCPLETIQINKQNQPKNKLKSQRHWKEHQPRQQSTTAWWAQRAINIFRDRVVSREEGFRYSHSKSLFPCIYLAGDDPGQG